MPRTNDAALQERERGLDAVRRNVAVNIDAVMVVNGLVHNSPIKSNGPVKSGSAIRTERGNIPPKANNVKSETHFFMPHQS